MCVTTEHWDIAKFIPEGAVSSLTFPMVLANCHLDLRKPVGVNLTWRIEISSFPNGKIITLFSLLHLKTVSRLPGKLGQIHCYLW